MTIRLPPIIMRNDPALSSVINEFGNAIDDIAGRNGVVMFENGVMMTAYSAAERDALSVPAGTQIWNSDTNTPEWFNGSSWIQGGGGGGGQPQPGQPLSTTVLGSEIAETATLPRYMSRLCSFAGTESVLMI